MSASKEPVVVTETVSGPPAESSEVNKSPSQGYLDSKADTVLVGTHKQSSVILKTLLAAILQLVYYLMTVAFSVRSYVRFLTYRIDSVGRYHHRSPQLIRNDVSDLKKIPQHVGVILNLGDVHTAGGRIEGLLNDAGEVASWCVGAGIGELSIFERTGALKKRPLEEVHEAIGSRLESYFGPGNAPAFSVSIPQLQETVGPTSKAVLKINLISAKDGRTMLVELTRTFAELAVAGKLSPNDLSIDFIDMELKKLVGPDPDLLVMFTPKIDLQGYPPWHLRLTEFYTLEDNNQVTYIAFLKALQQFSNVKINLGK